MTEQERARLDALRKIRWGKIDALENLKAAKTAAGKAEWKMAVKKFLTLEDAFSVSDERIAGECAWLIGQAESRN